MKKSKGQMTRSMSASQLGPEFHDFLYAPVGDDRNGMLLSVLSALARLNVDPWKEAAELSRLPRDTAIGRLASLIASLPDGRSAFPDREAIAARLIALLPRRAGLEIPSRNYLAGTGSLTKSHLLFIYVAMAIMAIVLSAQYIVQSRQPPAHMASAHGSDIGHVFAKTSPGSSGK
jgi:hypothetical protein